jgi:choline-glycine betaine transporter
MDRQLRFVLAQAAWMLCTTLLLVLFEALMIETFVMLSFVGLLIVTELTAPLTVVPPWRTRVRWVILIGLLAVLYVMIQGILQVVPPGVF